MWEDGPDLMIQMDQMRRAIVQLQALVGDMLCRPRIHMDVGQMAVEHLAFQVPAIDVNELSGQLNLGLTHQFTWTAEQPTPEAASIQSVQESETGAEPDNNAGVQLWPPIAEEVQTDP